MSKKSTTQFEDETHEALLDVHGETAELEEDSEDASDEEEEGEEE